MVREILRDADQIIIRDGLGRKAASVAEIVRVIVRAPEKRERGVDREKQIEHEERAAVRGAPFLARLYKIAYHQHEQHDRRDRREHIQKLRDRKRQRRARAAQKLLEGQRDRIDPEIDGRAVSAEKIEKHKDCAAGEKPAVQSFVVTVQGFHGEISPFFHPERRAARGRTSRRPSRPFS